VLFVFPFITHVTTYINPPPGARDCNPIRSPPTLYCYQLHYPCSNSS